MATQVTLLITGGALLLFALEGLVCIAMAYPFASVLVTLGGALGRQLALQGQVRAIHTGIVLLALPLLTGAESRLGPPPMREVRSVIEIDAAPEVVWPFVIGFSELPPPHELFFRLGIAYPQRAHIEGAGAGAIRHCEFSTGSFVEPITTWDPPHRLSFDVVSQPLPMQEWSPYQHVNAPHRIDNFRSRHGEFRLTALAGGRTRLEGSTWYEIEMFPQWYWVQWSDTLLHTIHNRVLRHIQQLSEQESRLG